MVISAICVPLISSIAPSPIPNTTAMAVTSCTRSDLMFASFPQFLARGKPIAHAAQGLDIAGRGGIVLDLLPEPANVYVQRSHIAHPIGVPNLIKQRLAVHDFP